MLFNHSLSSLMASSSSHQIFTSFHGPDVRKTFLSHLRQEFEHNGIKMFDDNEMPRSQLIAPTLTQAIKDSRISIVLLSKNYGSSSWCLDELLEILKCQEEAGQIVMTIFYGVDPSHVRKQTGDFGISFNETCALKTEEQRKKWSQALTYVGNIAGEDFKDCKNEAKMIEKIAKDVFNKLNVTPSREFEGMVGLDVHIKKIKSMLELDSDRVKIVGISGPAGIGKSSIARALHTQLSSSFPRSCFMDNLRGRYNSGSDEYTSKLGLQGQLLSEVLNQKCMTTRNLDMVQYWLHDKKVLIILDDVECLDQLESLANIEWFGHGSRVLVTTGNKEILEQHGITDVYHVGFPSETEALMIFCLSAFRQTSPPYGFGALAYDVAKICGNLPLGLKVLGSSLRGKRKDKWMDELPRLKNSLDKRIESVLKVGYESLQKKDQDLFLFIAVFFNYEDVDHVTSMLAKPNLNVRLGLENLANRCLIEDGKVVMHHLLQVMATYVISQQEDWKRKILTDAQQICYVLENGKGNGSILGISFYAGEINELKISEKAFERMYNLLFLEVYTSENKCYQHNDEMKVEIPEEMEFLPSLRLLSWDGYPRKSLPSRFCPKNLIELNMSHSQLEKLWEGTPLLANLKKINLGSSSCLKELPDLSNATNLENLNLPWCSALGELPSSISNLHKLVNLNLWFCKSLETIPDLSNLTSLRRINMAECHRLRKITGSIRHCSGIEFVLLSGSGNLKTFSTHLPTSITVINLDDSGIERITDCIKDLHRLRGLCVSNSRRLVSLPELPSSLEYLMADDCESLKRVSGPLNTPHAELDFTNCFKLDGQSRKTIIQRSFVEGYSFLPGSDIPAEFDYRAIGDSLIIPHSDFKRFKVCLVLSTGSGEADYVEDADQNNDNEFKVSRPLCRSIYIDVPRLKFPNKLGWEHLMIFHHSLPFMEPSKARRKTLLRFNCFDSKDIQIIECGIQMLTDETEGNKNEEDDVNDLMRRKRLLQSDEAASDVEEKSSDKEDYASESNESSDREDDEEGYKSDTIQTSDDEYEGFADKSVTRKRPRKTTVITNLKKRRS